jgi:four helix bundle protein
MDKKYLQLNDISAYKTAFHLSNYVWKIVVNWDGFAKNTVGMQFVRAVDSISANIAEGFGRYGKKDKIKFYRYSQGSLKECFDWLHKSKERNLLQGDEYQFIFAELEKLPMDISSLIAYTNRVLKE